MGNEIVEACKRLNSAINWELSQLPVSTYDLVASHLEYEVKRIRKMYSKK